MVLIAYLSMILDHLRFLAPQIGVNPFGRIAFPIFAYMIAFGMKKTKAKNKYISRLFIFALVSQIPFILMTKGYTLNLNGLTNLEKVQSLIIYFTSSFNMGFTLLLGALTIDMIERNKKMSEKGLGLGLMSITLLVMLSMYVSQILSFDYGFYGYLTILMFYIIPKEKKILQLAIFTILTYVYIYVRTLGDTLPFEVLFPKQAVQFYALLAFPIIFWVIPKKPNSKYRILKYAIYPAHMLAIYVIAQTLKTI